MAQEARREQYPEVEPYATGMLRVSELHEIYYEEVGNPNGVPAVVFHGGPGGGCNPGYRRYFDPARYRVVLFDQRGCNRSKPRACLEENTTWDLVADAELIRAHLGIEKWVVFGGSWGSTLSLAYSEKHVDRVKALVLRGIFTLRREELLWFYQSGASFIYPDAFERYVAPIPEAERGDIISAFHRRLTGDNEEEQMACARAWSCWEMETSKLYVDPAYIARAADDDKFALEFARIECHYFVHAGFFERDGQLIEDATVLKDVPGTIVQGRYDMVCPAKTAWDLHNAAPHFDFKMVPDAGHSCTEPGITDQLVRATDKYAD
eukprot:CAMPEP_0114614306 /NCGR_PEP_ID=MMETSP0168-20121206/5582_1 /TAXON_ID=95228 ORGANISM="Vannella sp., Strain DIVA3 517/6/12" /NCGR_SAMPLE_ID=MMETSP0168 /ASSEMBLY_ACC=CAM_ASM_000044 /LENGTH=320 /DNA_ID=CAMNT_0001825343 /DNA_START=34 /DNA_END=993 /DNA_ORIENTATION=-